MRTVEYKTDLCVVGGGMAGLCCAIAENADMIDSY